MMSKQKIIIEMNKIASGKAHTISLYRKKLIDNPYVKLTMGFIDI